MNLEPTRTSASRDRGPSLVGGRLHQRQRVVIVAVLFLTVVGSEALTRQPALGTHRQLCHQNGDLLGRHRVITHEPQTLGLSDVHPIETQDVEVQVQIQRRPEPLDHRD
jgi:hypothetical protein